MDHAREVELSILEKQKPMNAVIDRGDSTVQQFYSGAAVFVTGGSGFLGKQLIEKLFRSCEITKLYMLMRPKKGKTIEQRLAYVLKDALYDNLREKKPNFADCIVPVEGDIAEIGLGLSHKDFTNIAQEVNVIIHMAATVNFDEPLRRAGLINVRGTREMITLARQCPNLKIFNHVSTAFAHATFSKINTDVFEKFYPCPIPPDVFIGMVESLEESRLNALTPALISDWPNTYTFTKAIAEELIRTSAGDLPVCIVKPPVVTSSFVEPTPGWMDNQTVMSSPIGILLGAGLGVMHTLLVDTNVSVTFAPVDYVNNAIIVSGWDAVMNRRENTDIPIYTVSLSGSGIKWKSFTSLFRTEEFRKLGSPKCLWYPYVLETSNFYVYWMMTWLLHYIPGYFVDAIVSLLGVRPKKLPSLTKVYTKVYKLTMVYTYFLSHDWNFRDDNLSSMIKRMSAEDKAIYNCNIYDIDIKELMKALCIGLRRYIVRDGLKGTAEGYRKQKWLKFANIIFLILYAYFIYYVIYIVYSTLAKIVPM